MFAFALWDTKRRRLLLARDRMGEKPLYLFETGRHLIFASEMKALLRSGSIPFELDPIAVDLYFHYQYIPEPGTPIKGVRKLEAGHVLTVDADPWQVQDTCYWRMEDAPPLEGDPAELIRSELETVSQLVIRSDVPVGVALSGGLDSSAIAALAVRKYPDTMHAFSVGYPDHLPNDERVEARALADNLHMPFHDVELATEDMVTFFPELVYWRDDPIADISGYGYYAVMKLAREFNVPVVLQGQGGDELFWGYPWVSQAVGESLQKSSLWLKDWLALKDYLKLEFPKTYSRRSLWDWFTSLSGLRTGWKRFHDHRASLIDQLIFYDLVPDFKMACNGVEDIYGPALMEHLDGARAFDIFTFPQPWPDVSVLLTLLTCQTYLLGNGITQGDRLSMASSVELRLPLVDHCFVETVVGLRKTQTDHHLPPKSWFKAALNGILPDRVINRPKRGFAPPVRVWHQALFSAYGSMLDDGYLVREGVLRQDSARTLSCGPFPRKAGCPISFKALVLEIWCRRISNSSQAAPDCHTTVRMSAESN
jgi:asparagine synthase (glutamine-hydrolysing)